MANIDNATGFRPVRGGACINPYSIASGLAEDLVTGMPVKMTGTGNNISQAAGGTTNAIGVLKGVEYVDSEGKKVFTEHFKSGTTGTEIKAFVYDDPETVFEIQCDTLNEADVGLLADWAIGAVDATLRTSATELVASTGATTGKSCRILRKRSNDEYGASCGAEVIFVEHAMRGVVAGVGGV